MCVVVRSYVASTYDDMSNYGTTNTYCNIIIIIAITTVLLRVDDEANVRDVMNSQKNIS